MVHRLSLHSVRKGEAESLVGALVTQDQSKAVADATVVQIAGPNLERLVTFGPLPCPRRRPVPWEAECRPATRFAICRTQSYVGRGADAPGWSALPLAFACPLLLWPAAIPSWSLPKSASLGGEGVDQNAARGSVAADSESSTAAGAPAQSRILEEGVHASQTPKKVVGQNSWLPGAAGHGRSSTWTGWADYDSEE